MKDKIVGRLMLVPIVLTFLFFIIYPVYKVVEYSFFMQHTYSGDRTFVGFQNFITIFNRPDFFLALKNTMVWTFGTVFLQLIVGLAVALLLNAEFPGRNFIRSMILFSYLIPIVVAVIAWKFMLTGDTGIINYMFSELNLPFTPRWLSNPKTAMMAVVFIEVWKNFPFMVIVFLAQLQSIKKVQYEAARVDGASKFQEFWHITIPFLKPVIFIALIFRTIFEFKYFDMIYLLTGGGPLKMTTTLPILIYNIILQEFSLGRGSAIAVIMFIIVFVFAVIYLRFYSKAQQQLT